MKVFRSEHPRTQMRRADWINLNGEWQFEIDRGDTGRARGLLERELGGRINVPFCPESELSGVGERDFMASVWYRRTFTLPDDWADERVLLHFGAVDYLCEAFVNGVSAGAHRGGYTSFEFEITRLLRPGENVLVVHARDDLRSGRQPAGKQSPLYESHGCFYTRTTGIWQTVWLERLPATALRDVRYEPDVDNACVYVQALLDGDCAGVAMRVETF
ncbi:MAG: sugar-binding domain-containing protein, partial [Candidatus Fimadaptatus sp.]